MDSLMEIKNENEREKEKDERVTRKYYTQKEFNFVSVRPSMVGGGW